MIVTCCWKASFLAPSLDSVVAACWAVLISSSASRTWLAWSATVREYSSYLCTYDLCTAQYDNVLSVRCVQIHYTRASGRGLGPGN
jgi:hypothetical protein